MSPFPSPVFINVLFDLINPDVRDPDDAILTLFETLITFAFNGFGTLKVLV